MKLAALSYAEGMAAAAVMPFAWIRSYSDLYLGLTPELWEEAEVVEARFFDGTSEIRFFRTDGVMQAALVCAEDEDMLLRRTYRIANPKYGKRLTTTTLLRPDEDGQMDPATVFLSGWEAADHER